MRTEHTLFGLLFVAVASCIFLALFLVSKETIFALAMFNFLFISLTFPLNGTLQRKVSMLLMAMSFACFGITLSHCLQLLFAVVLGDYSMLFS